MKTYSVILSSGLLLSSIGSAYEIEPLTHDTQLWSKSLELTTERFSKFEWQLQEQGAQSAKSELTFNGKQISSVELSTGEKKLITKLQINILNGPSALKFSKQDFGNEALSWKNAIDDSLALKGLSLPVQTQGSRKIKQVVWEADHCIIVLNASMVEQPEQLDISIFAKSAAPKSVVASLTGDGKTASSNTAGEVSNALKGITSYFQSGKFNKKDISKNPTHYLLYFSASW